MPIEIDSEFKIPYYSTVCMFCKHYKMGTRPPSCSAFSDGIPIDIWNGKNKHTKPYPGDGGILFDPEDENA